MFISTFDLFKIGIGPSSSHTMGPMVAAKRFLLSLADIKIGASGPPAEIKVTLFGSLAFTGKGHASDRAVCLGLLGHDPQTVDPADVSPALDELQRKCQIKHSRWGDMKFDPQTDLIFDYGPALPLHPNGMIFEAQNSDGDAVYKATYYSPGGGFVADDVEMAQQENPRIESTAIPFPFNNAREMLQQGKDSGLTISEMKRRNEIAYLLNSDSAGNKKLSHHQSTESSELDTQINDQMNRIWQEMSNCIERGIAGSGQLPGGLAVKRRAGEIHRQLIADTGSNRPFDHAVMDWLSVYALAVNEENAAGGRVVTAPTNGAAGVVPAVMSYYQHHCPGASQSGIYEFLLTAAAIGGLIKANASISGAEVGCQGEVGSAAAMAAAGLAAALGASNEQIENAAEIALEHHLGMTCDPVGGLVQVPCIERNAMGAVKAVNAASLAMRGDGSHFVPLDSCIETMRQTGHDMKDKYKETSKGGLAVNIVAC